MVLEEDGDAAVEVEVEHGHELALDAVGDAGRAAGVDLGREQLRWVLHGESFLWELGATCGAGRGIVHGRAERFDRPMR